MGSPSRYAQVARTYAHRWPLWLIAAAMGGYFYVLYGSPLTVTMKSERLMLLAALMWITAWASGTVAAHVKQQFTDASAALVPGYRTPHLLIGALAMLLVAVLVPALATSCTCATPRCPLSSSCSRDSRRSQQSWAGISTPARDGRRRWRSDCSRSESSSRSMVTAVGAAPTWSEETVTDCN